jgi:hypothetical protein
MVREKAGQFAPPVGIKVKPAYALVAGWLSASAPPEVSSGWRIDLGFGDDLCCGSIIAVEPVIGIVILVRVIQGRRPIP